MKSKLDFLEPETYVLQSNKVSSFMEGIEPRLGNLETDILEMKADIKNIELRLGNLEAEVAVMKTDIVDIKTKMAIMQTDIGNIKEGISNMAADIEKILLEQSKFKDDVYKWGIALMIGVVVSVSSIVSLIVMFVN